LLGGGEVNWEAIGSIGEAVGAIGVIVSLLYLATQVTDRWNEPLAVKTLR
jgi:hypothetical protein